MPIRPAPLVLRNGSARDRPLTQVLEAKEHGERPLELAVEMDLVTAKPFQLVGVERLTKGLLPDQRAIDEFLLAVLEPGQHLALQKAAQTIGVCNGGRLALIQFVGPTR